MIEPIIFFSKIIKCALKSEFSPHFFLIESQLKPHKLDASPCMWVVTQEIINNWKKKKKAWREERVIVHIERDRYLAFRIYQNKVRDGNTWKGGKLGIMLMSCFVIEVRLSSLVHGFSCDYEKETTFLGW